MCAGYVIGVRDAANYQTDTVRNVASKKSGFLDAFCPRQGTTRGEYVDAFNEYMKLKPNMGEGHAAGVVLLAFEWKFPCKKRSKK